MAGFCVSDWLNGVRVSNGFHHLLQVDVLVQQHTADNNKLQQELFAARGAAEAATHTAVASQLERQAQQQQLQQLTAMVGDLLGCLQQAADCMQQSLADEVYHAKEASAALQQLQGVRTALEGLRGGGPGFTTAERALGGRVEMQVEQGTMGAGERGPGGVQGLAGGGGVDEEEQEQDQGPVQEEEGSEQDQRQAGGRKRLRKQQGPQPGQEQGNENEGVKGRQRHGRQQLQQPEKPSVERLQQQQQQEQVKEFLRETTLAVTAAEDLSETDCQEAPATGFQQASGTTGLPPAPQQHQRDEMVHQQTAEVRSTQAGDRDVVARVVTEAAADDSGRVPALPQRRTRRNTLAAVPTGENRGAARGAGVTLEQQQQQQSGSRPGLKASEGLALDASDNCEAAEAGKGTRVGGRRGGRWSVATGGRGKHAVDWGRGPARGRFGAALSPIREAAPAVQGGKVELGVESMTAVAEVAVTGPEIAGGSGGSLGSKRVMRSILPLAKRTKGNGGAARVLSPVQETAGDGGVAGEGESQQGEDQAAAAVASVGKGAAEGGSVGAAVAVQAAPGGAGDVGLDAEDWEARGLKEGHIEGVAAAEGKLPKQKATAARRKAAATGTAAQGMAKPAVIFDDQGEQGGGAGDTVGGEADEWRPAEEVLKELIGNAAAGGGRLPVATGRRATFAMGTKCSGDSSGRFKAVRRGRQTGAAGSMQGLSMVEEDSGQLEEGVLRGGGAGKGQEEVSGAAPAGAGVVAKRRKRASWGGEGESEQLPMSRAAEGLEQRRGARGGAKGAATPVAMRTRHRHPV